nr:hypothetical protein [Tanacetum cinerariifolium]
MDRFATAILSASQKAGDHNVPSTGQDGTHPAEERRIQGERFQMTQEEMENQKCIKQAFKADVARFEIKKGKMDMIDIVGLDVVEKVYKDKVYRDDGIDEIINNFKISDLHLGE